MAIAVSDAFKTAMKAPIKRLRAKIVTDEETPQSFTSADSLISFAVESAGYYFGTAMTAIEIKLIGSNYNLVGVDVNISFDVQTDVTKDTWSTCDYGGFGITEQTADLEKGVTTLKGYNFMGEFANTLYLENDITFPRTVAELATQIGQDFAVTINTDFTTLPNYNYTIREDLYSKINNINYRDILAEIGGATATLVKCRGNGSVDFIPPMKTPLETWTYANLKKIKFEPKYGVVNAVVLARTPQEDNIVVRDEESIEANGLTEVKLANNEILDDDRQDLAQPILDAVDGFYFYPFEATTEGHGWHEVGDRIAVTDGTNTWEVIVTDVKVEIGQGIKETVKGIAPTPTQTDYARAGGIMKTIYNTEIKVDKQNQTIESVISELTQLDEETQENFTQILQNITNVITSVQNSGGSNLIKNSVGYFLGDNALPLNWDCTVGTSLLIQPSSESQAHGSLSGNIMTLVGSTIKQRVTVATGTNQDGEPYKYAFSVRVKKGAVGTGSVTLNDGVSNWVLNFASGDDPYYDEFTLKEITPQNNYLDVTATGSSDSDFTVTDMMLSVGDYQSQWQQANGEFANTQVNIDINGVTVRSSTVQGSYTLNTPFRFAGYQNGNLVYSLDADAVKSKKAVLTDSIEMPPIKIVPFTSGSKQGWAFVKMEGN